MIENKALYFQAKKKLGQTVVEENHNFSSFWECNIHGMHTHWHLPNKQLKTALEAHFPQSWQNKQPDPPDHVIQWIDPTKSPLFHFKLFEEDPDSDCHIIQEGGWTYTIQRDFICLSKKNKFFLIAPPRWGDGLYNFLRWLLPKYLLSRNFLLLHSSCVLLENKTCLLFLGPSGAGKTTLSQLAQPRLILGDDMNLLKWKNNTPVITPSLFGQRIENPQLFGLEFPLKGIFWLQQSQRNTSYPIAFPNKFLKFYSCCANLFWPYLKDNEIKKVQNMTMKLLSQIDFSILEFTKTKGAWNYVESNIKPSF